MRQGLPFLLASVLVSSVASAQGEPPPEPRPPLLPAPGDTMPPPPPPPPAVASASDERIHALEARLAELEKKQEGLKLPDWLSGVSVSGFVQPQLLLNVYNAAASPNATGGVLPATTDPNNPVGANDVIAKANGDTTNTNFFRVRRARVKVTYAPNPYAKFMIELEPVPAGGSIPGSGTVGRNIEAQALVPLGENGKLTFGAGIFKVPFNFETPQSDADRPFIERSFMQRNMIPAEFDAGLHADFQWKKKVTVIASVINGHTIGEQDFAVVPDLNRAKDFTLRGVYDFGDATVGLSGYAGRGQVVDAQKLRFKQFPRWALGAEASLQHVFLKRFGQTAAYAELVYARNLDRGTISAANLPKIPDKITDDVTDKEELGAFVRVEQNLGPIFMLGARWDFYTPDLNVPENGRHTVAGLFVVNMGKGLRTMLEYDHAMDTIHTSGAAPMKLSDTVSCVLQGRL
jgi:hypothetical protein